MTIRDPAFDSWIARGRAVRVVQELRRRGHYGRLKKSGRELVGPCPLCGGDDRFGVRPAENLWNCRKCGVGGDAIALVSHVDGVDFLAAIGILLDEPPPGPSQAETVAERQARQDRQAALVRKIEAQQRREDAEAAAFRERERHRAFDLWRRARPIAGTRAEAYLKLRGLVAPPEAWLRFLPDHPLWSAPPPKGAIVHRGPAMLAGVMAPDGHFGAVHTTWIDLAQPKGKAVIPDPADPAGTIPAKKVRGSKKGGSILLARATGGAPHVLFIGEGIETVLSIWAALRRVDDPVLGLAEFRSSVDLGNLAGKAAGRVPHPTDTLTDKAGRVRRRMVPSGEPSLDIGDPVIAIAPTIREIVLIGDGDSDPFDTRLALERAAARFADAYPDVTVRLAMAPENTDFNDLWRAIASDAPTPEPV